MSLKVILSSLFTNKNNDDHQSKSFNMPNYSSSSVNTVDWAMGYEGSCTVKQRNLLEGLHVSSTPIPPPFQDFISLVHTKKRTHTSLSLSSNSSDGSCYLPHQTPSPLLDHTNYKYAKIRARPLYNFNYNESSIWTHSSTSTMDTLSNTLPFDMDVVNKFFVKENKIIQQSPRTSFSTTSMTRSFQILDKSSQITYDVTMRHLIQLLSKTHSTIDDVLRGIDTGDINSEWLQCVQRLNKQFQKHCKNKLQFETFNLEHLHELNTVEQFFVQLLRIPNYNFKLKCYQYRDESHSQLLLLHQTIDQLLHGINRVLNHEHLPQIFQILCLLYNIVSNKCVPGLDFISLIDALNSPTNQSNKTVAHALVEILDKYYQNTLLHTINDETLIELKKVHAIKYDKICAEIREIYEQYQQMAYEYSLLKNNYDLPLFISSMLSESKIQFENFFEKESLLRKGERDLAAYFCSNDLSVDCCLSMIGQFIDKLRLANLENTKEQQRRLSGKANERQRSTSLLVNTAASFLSCV
ncbi:unnamed protein product [Adineta ricciae]|uniref:FH2 domain-containing protein n=1 Tax=Adineta ricciae TaxID=249248 RepID=A0A813N367_ADIRI|nr:unnamed protein product [Adineta ricciae]